MNVLLAMPSSYGKTETFFPLGIAYVSASMKENETSGGYKIYTINLKYINEDAETFLKNYIEGHDIQVFATSGLSREYNSIRRLLEIVKRIRPEILTWVGGGIITADPETAMAALEFADIGIIGEGEVTCCELASTLANGQAYDNLKGIIYKRNSEFYTNEKREDIKDLDSLPFPDYDGFCYKNYLEENRSGTYFTIVGSRSCPFSCTFCFHPSGVTYRQRSLDSIFDEIDYLFKRYPHGEMTMGMVDELFASDEKRLKEFCARISRYHILWECQLRVTDVTKDILAMMKESGCYLISYGIESADDRILKSMKKHITVKQIELALESTYDAGIAIQGNLIFGDVNETIETFRNSRQWLKENRKYGVLQSPIAVFPGTPLYDYACANKIIKDKIQYLKDGCPLINISTLTENEYWDLVSDLYVDTYGWLDEIVKVTLLSCEENGIAKAKYECLHCGGLNTIEFSMFDPSLRYFCSNCGKSFTMDLTMFAGDMEIEFAEEEIIAFWGPSQILGRLIKRYGIMEHYPNSFFVDIDPTRQKQTFCGFPIHATELISEKEIKNVAIAAVSRKKEIFRDIKDRYPSVQNIYTLRNKRIGDKLIITYAKYEGK